MIGELLPTEGWRRLKSLDVPRAYDICGLQRGALINDGCHSGALAGLLGQTQLRIERPTTSRQFSPMCLGNAGAWPPACVEGKRTTFRGFMLGEPLYGLDPRGR